MDESHKEIFASADAHKIAVKNKERENSEGKQQHNSWLNNGKPLRDAVKETLIFSDSINLEHAATSWIAYAEWWRNGTESASISDYIKLAIEQEIKNKDVFDRAERMLLLLIFQAAFDGETESIKTLVKKAPSVRRRKHGLSERLQCVEEACGLNRQSHLGKNYGLLLRHPMANHPKYHAEKQKALDLKNSVLSWAEMDVRYENKEIKYKNDVISKYAKATGQSVKQKKGGRPRNEL